MVPPNSIRVSRAPTYSGYHYLIQRLLIRDYHPPRFIFPDDSNPLCLKYRGPTTPILPEQHWLGLIRVRSPLLSESLLFSSPLPTEMFQFSSFAFLSECCVFNTTGCPIRISADHIVCANPRSFSQLITSFFASERLGIPHTPLVFSVCSKI